MAETSDLIKSVVTGLLTGGASAGLAFFSTQGNIKKRLEAVELQLGASVDPKSGLNLAVSNLEELVRRLRKDFDSFEDAPPAWVTKLMTRSRTQSGLNLEIADSLDEKIRAVLDRMKRVEEAGDNRYVTRSDYENDNRERAKQVAKIQEEMAATGGMLRGMVATMGIELPEGRRPPR